MGQQEPHEVQQVEVQNPAHGEELPHAPVHAGGRPCGKQLCRKSPEVPGGHQVERKPAMLPSSKGD